MLQDLLARVGEQHHDRNRGEEIDQRRCDGLLRDVTKITRFEPRGGNVKTIGFDLFSTERLYYLVTADGLLQDLIQLRGVILSAACGAADAASEARGRHQDKWQHGEADEGQPPVHLQHHAEQEDRGEGLPQPVRQNVRRRHLDLFNVVHDGRHETSRRGGFKKLRILAQDAIENALAQVRYRGEADVVDQVVSKVIADALEDISAQDPGRDHGPNVVYGRRDKLIQIDDVARDFEKRDRGIGGTGIEDAVEYGFDEEGHQSLRCANQEHQEDGAQEVWRVRADESQQPREFAHEARLMRRLVSRWKGVGLLRVLGRLRSLRFRPI